MELTQLHPRFTSLPWESPDQTPGDSSVSDASLKPKEFWALGDPVFRALFREPGDNHRQPREPWAAFEQGTRDYKSTPHGYF